MTEKQIKKEKIMATIRLDWVANPSTEFVTNYIIYKSVNGGSLSIQGNTSNNFFEIVNPNPGVYSFSIQATNIAGTSAMSDVGFGPSVPSKPATPVVTIL